MNQHKAILKIEGMSCSNCANGIKKHLEKHGVKNVNVNFTTKEASYDSKNQDKNHIIKLIENLGYKILTEEETKSPIERYLYITLFFPIIS